MRSKGLISTAVLLVSCTSLVKAGSPHVHSLGRYLGWGWGSGYHARCAPAWYTAGWAIDEQAYGEYAGPENVAIPPPQSIDQRAPSANPGLNRTGPVINDPNQRPTTLAPSTTGTMFAPAGYPLNRAELSRPKTGLPFRTMPIP